MKLIVGLGNPGKKYEKTRHNVGFRVISDLHLSAAQPASFSFKKNFQAEIKEIKSRQEKIILAKPMTLMNNSGQAVLALATYWKIKPVNIWLIHDDIDLPLGVIRISHRRGSGGHKGVQSIIDGCRTKNLLRFRIGIHPLGRKKSLEAEKFVLQKFTPSEEKIISGIVQKTSRAIKTALKQGIEEAMNEFN